MGPWMMDFGKMMREFDSFAPLQQGVREKFLYKILNENELKQIILGKKYEPR